MNRAERQAEIERRIRDRENADAIIHQIVSEAEPRYHFLDHWISYFWKCEPSPFGWCLFPQDEHGIRGDNGCIYCGNPLERK